MRRLLALGLAAVMTCGTLSAAAVPEIPRFRRIGVPEGLPSVTVYGIDQDREGYIWLATGDGLARYDAVGYRVWQRMPGDPDALPGNVVQALHVDAQDRVWVGTEGGGLSVLDGERSRFRHFRRDTHPELGSDDVWAIASTADGALWFGTFGGGLHRLSPEGEIRRFMPVDGDPRSLPADTVMTLAVDADGVLWVGTVGGLARWTGNDFERVPSERLSGSFIYSLSAERDGRLWIGTRGGLDVREADGRIASVPWRKGLSDPVVVAVRADPAGGHWIATLRGIDRELDGHVRTVTPGQDPIGLLAAYPDREGGVWFGTHGKGLARLPAGWRQFGALPDPRQPDLPRIGQVRGFAEALDGGLWLVGSGGGLDRIDPGGRIERRLDAGAGLPESSLWSVLQHRDGAVWIGYRNGLTRYDPMTGALRHWRGDAEDAPPPGPIDLLAEDGQGRVWLSAYGGGVQARSADGTVLHTVRPGDGRGLESPDVELLATGPDGRLWLAHGRGLSAWDDAAASFVPVPGIPAERVFGFASAAQTVWLYRLGVLEAHRWDGARLHLLQRLDERAGLPAVEGGGLVLGEDAVWITTPRGLVRYRPSDRNVRIYGVRDGLPDQAFGNRPALRTRAGVAVAGTADGVVLFDATPPAAAGGMPPLAIERVTVRRGEVLHQLDPDAPLRLAPDDRDLRVSARLLSFLDPAAHRYRFRLRGYEDEWIDAGSGGERLFSRLDAGHYLLDVQAADAAGRWSAPRSLAIEALPPWWRTGWAWAAYLLIAVATVALGLRGYRRRLERDHQLRLAHERQTLAVQASEAKTRFLATLGHEVRTPMTGVLGMAELLQGTALDATQRGYVDAIRGAGEHLLRLVNDTLDLARIEAGKLDLVAAPFSPRQLLREVADLLAPLAARKGLDFACEAAPDLPQALCGDVHRVRQILLNLGTNAIKFTERGHVVIGAAALSPQGLLLRVDDSGLGLNAEQRSRLFRRFEQGEGGRTAARYGGSGLGLAICEELAAAMGGAIRVESAVGQGSSFMVELPLAVADAALPQAAGTPSSQSLSLRILLVEDDLTIARVIAGLLEGQGHVVTHVPHGLGALAALAQASFDLGLLDLDLPGIDGLELARLIRAQGRRIPLIAVTARSDSEAEAQARAAGMTGFLRKPVSGELLAAAVGAGAAMPAEACE